jgi:L-aminoadipate-semialdehyde dehydrogenase
LEVVAIMGILKAGAAFSVIDPLYPPDRQIIYLDVAQPRALVNLQKATLEAGPLDKSVRDFITARLDLRTEVPSLLIQDDGSLQSGLIKADKDIFINASTEDRKVPGVEIFPDDIPTLS